MLQYFGDSGHGGGRKQGEMRRKRSIREMERSMVFVQSDGAAGTDVLGSSPTLVMGWYTYLPVKTKSGQI